MAPSAGHSFAFAVVFLTSGWTSEFLASGLASLEAAGASPETVRRNFCMTRQLLIILIVLTLSVRSQVPGQWKWTTSSNQPGYAGSFGIKGVSSVTNKPPAIYECYEWTDTAGNFWIYGGDSPLNWQDNLWKFTVSTKQWTWISGSGAVGNQPPVYGTLTIPCSTCSPGGNMYNPSWVDKQNNFWLLANNAELWKFNSNNSTWTWMKGGPSVTPYYGTKGVESSLNNPPSIFDMGITWVDNTGDLWMMDNKGCLWNYRIATSNWIWVNGNYQAVYPNPVYGTKGVPSASNTPGHTYFDYTRWKDSNGNFWFLNARGSGYLKVLWKYNVVQNMWTWVSGDTTFVGTCNYGTIKCDKNNPSIDVRNRIESRACWIDNCDNLWMFGGGSVDTQSNIGINDLVYYSTKNGTWTWVSGDTNQVSASIYGTMNVSSPTSKPGYRLGSVPFKDKSGNLYIFGGQGPNNIFLPDLWMYTPDTACSSCSFIDGIKEKAPDKPVFKVYPNPSSGKIHFSFTESQAEIGVFNSLGTLLFTKIIRPAEYLILEPGIYFVSFKADNKVDAKKIIITQDK